MWMLENLRTQRQAKCNPCSQGSSLSKGKERANNIINEQQETRGFRSRGDTHWFHQGKGTEKVLVPINVTASSLQTYFFFFFFLILWCWGWETHISALPSGCCFGSENGVPQGACKAGEGRRDLLLPLRSPLIFSFLSVSISILPAWLLHSGWTSNWSHFSDSPRLTEPAWLYPLRDTSPSWPAHPLLRQKWRPPPLSSETSSQPGSTLRQPWVSRLGRTPPPSL